MSAGDAQPPASAGHDTGSGRLGGTRVRQQAPPRAWGVEAGAHPVPITSMWAEHLAGTRASTAPLTPPSTQAPALAAGAGRRPPDPAARSETERSRRESARKMTPGVSSCFAWQHSGEGRELSRPDRLHSSPPPPPPQQGGHSRSGPSVPMACLPSQRKGTSALCLSWDVDLLRMDFGPPGSQAFGLGLNYISGFPGQQRTDRTSWDPWPPSHEPVPLTVSIIYLYLSNLSIICLLSVIYQSIYYLSTHPSIFPSTYLPASLNLLLVCFSGEP